MILNRRRIAAYVCLVTFLLTASCSSNRNTADEADRMVGIVSGIDAQKHIISFDISEWMLRDELGLPVDDWDAEYTARVLQSTKIRDEAGEELTWDDIKLGQKIQIQASTSKLSRDKPEELVILKQNNIEVHRRLGLLASAEGSYRTVIMYEQGAQLPYSSEVIEREAPIVFNNELSWLEYNPEYVIDLKRSLDIRSLPVFLVFDHERLMIRTTRLANVTAFLSSVQEN